MNLATAPARHAYGKYAIEQKFSRHYRETVRAAQVFAVSPVLGSAEAERRQASHAVPSHRNWTRNSPTAPRLRTLSYSFLPKYLQRLTDR